MRRDKSIIKRAEKIVKTYICKVRPLTDEEKEQLRIRIALSIEHAK
jgi:hypothetical protein